ncbi:restriction endonuclease subunit S [Streptococcus infantis]|uniref:restriction endonuclease subunit S n=1 Tax=Streptococcus infantis TaxID=68892 RepID=UPI0039C0B5A1
MNNFKIPKIRFMNFNDKWKYKILGEISNSIEYGLNASAKDFDGIHKYLRITDIDDSSRLFLTDKLSSPDVNFTEEDYENYKLQINDLLFARTGASVGKTYLYRESDGEVYYAGFLIRARLHDSYDGNFIFQQTLTDKYKQFIEITSQRSGQPGVNGKEYGDWKIGMTSYPEQSAIGSLFRTIDDLLASYKDNLANYQSLKTTMLAKMFPKTGQTVPEIRLEGFEGEWEIRKLSEVSDVYDGTHQTPNYTESGVKFLSVENISTLESEKYISEEDFEKDFKVFPEFGDVLMTRIGSIGVPNIVKTNEKIAFYVSLALLKPKKKTNSLFMKSSIESNPFQEELWKKTLHIAFPKKINKNDISQSTIKCPSYEEQQAIGIYLSNLDSFISAHQEKISQLETLKKKLLQDMFI